MNSHPPPFPAYGDLTAAAAAAAAGYNAAAPSYGRPRTAEGLVTSPASYGYPVHGSPAFANAGLHGALPVQPYATRGLHGNESFDGALQGHAWGLPSTAGFVGAPPGHAYDAAGLRNANFFHGDAYAAPGQGHHLAGLNPGAPSFERRGTSAQELAIHSVPRQDSIEDGVSRQAGGALNRGLNPRARSFERRETGAQQRAISFVPLHNPTLDAGRDLNAGARSHCLDSRKDGGGGLNSSFDRNQSLMDGGRHLAGAPYSLPGINQIGSNNYIDSNQSPLMDAGPHLQGAPWHTLLGIHQIGSNQSLMDGGRHLAAAPHSLPCLNQLGSNSYFDGNQSPLMDAGPHLEGAPWHTLLGIHQIVPSCEWSSRVLFAETEVRQVWRHNCLEAFHDIKDLIDNTKGRVYVAIDLEYLAADTTDITSKPNTLDEWYESLQSYVNSGSVVQIGLAFASEDKMVAYELNLLVDVCKGKFHPDAVAFLKRNCHDFDKHKAVGILPEWIWAGVLRNLPFGSENIIWLAYHGDRDIGFILRLLEGGGRGVTLPPHLDSFLNRFREMFPVYYDVRILAQLVKEGFHGKLTVLAGDEYLGVKRTGGEHHAGSDALLTLRCFVKIIQGYKLEALVCRKCILSGVEELRLPITCCRHISASDINVVEVYNNNLDQEAFYISQTIENNFRIIGAQIIAPQILNLVKPDYNTLRSAVRELNRFELLLTFGNLEGNVAYGRTWKFFFQVADEDQIRVSTLRLAALLASCGSTHDTSCVWVTHGGDNVLACLLQAFIAPGLLPVSYARYKLARANLFPKVDDVKLLVKVCTGLGGDLGETALQLGVAADACDAVTILRCFYSLRGKNCMDIGDQS